MKRLLLSVAVVLGIVWAGTSWYVGQQTESVLQQFISAQNEQAASLGITQEIVSCERSLLGAHAITRLTTSAPPLNELIGEVQLVSDITNGPVFFGGGSPVQFGLSRIKTRLDMDSLDEETRQWLAAAFDGEQPFKAHALVSFSGVTDYRITLNPMKLDRDGTTFVMEGAAVAGSADADMLGTFRMQAGTIEIRTDKSSFTIPSVEASGTITAIVAGQAIGSFGISAPQVAITSPEAAEPFTFDAALKTSSAVKDSAAEGTFDLVMDNIQGGGNFLSKLDYSLEFEGINIAGLEEINRIQKDMVKLRDQMGWDEEAMKTPEGVQRMQELLTGFTEQMVEAVFSKLLQTGKSRMRNVLVATSPGGKAHADIDLTYTGKGTPGMTQLSSYGPDDWAKMLKGTIVLNLDQAMLPEGFVMVLMPFIQQGLIVQMDDTLQARIELAGESVVLNGTRMRFTDLLHMLSPTTGEDMLEEDINAGTGMPADLMQKIQKEGLTPEVMQLLEERDDVPAETLEMLRQLQRVQQDMQAGTMPERR